MQPARGHDSALSAMGTAHAMLLNSFGRYDAALDEAQQACAYEAAPTIHPLARVELIEAAVRSEQPELAAVAIEHLSERTQASGSEWALGVEARSRALLADGPAAEALYLKAIGHLGNCNIAPHLARVHLIYGEWLRREKRRGDAREQLRTAFDTFSRLGAEAWAERARRELLATGETTRKRTPETRDVLTPQEAQIAGMAGAGLTNPEIARAALHQPPHGRIPPPQGVRQARRRLSPRARRRAREQLTPASRPACGATRASAGSSRQAATCSAAASRIS